MLQTIGLPCLVHAMLGQKISLENCEREALAVAIAAGSLLSSNSWGRVRAPKQQRLFSTFAFNARGNARCSGAGLEDSHSEPQVEVSAI